MDDRLLGSFAITVAFRCAVRTHRLMHPSHRARTEGNMERRAGLAQPAGHGPRAYGLRGRIEGHDGLVAQEKRS